MVTRTGRSAFLFLIYNKECHGEGFGKLCLFAILQVLSLMSAFA